MVESIDFEADVLVAKIKHYLITILGQTLEHASDQEFYLAFSMAIREEIMTHWIACQKTFEENNSKMIYYISMEFYPGRILGNNITNLAARELIKIVFKKCRRNLRTIFLTEPEPGLGNGGLGRLASCFLDSLATKEYPSFGYGLRYQYGIFRQEIWNGKQVEKPDPWLLHENPWSFRRDMVAYLVPFCGRVEEFTNHNGTKAHKLQDYDEVRAMAFDIPIIGYTGKNGSYVSSLRLWSTKESPKNFQLQRYNAGHLDQASENVALTDVLYPNDNNEIGRRTRLKQEFLLVSASLQDILQRYFKNHSSIKNLKDKVRIQINDTHPSLVIAELMRLLVGEYHCDWKNAWEITQTCVSYTNHTIMSEALEKWDQSLMKFLLPRQYHIIERINQEFCDLIRKKFPHDESKVRNMSILEDSKVRMANLAICGSHHINGVAALHTKILQDSLFKDFYDLFPEKFVNITNGVTQRRWLLHSNPLLAEFITKLIGNEWITDFSKIYNLAQYSSREEVQKQFLEIKRQNKEKLIQELINSPLNYFKNAEGEPIEAHYTIDPTALFDVQIKRFHEYKRQIMNALHIIMIYHELKKNPKARAINRCCIFGGKAAPGYTTAKNTITLIYCLQQKINADPEMQGKLHVIFVQNYNVSKAQLIIPAADLSEQISTAGMEASGTGNMKLAINGALTIGTEDGANIEMRQSIGDEWWPFRFGLSSKEVQELRSRNEYHPMDICAQHENIKNALDSLRDRTWAQDDSQHEALCQLYETLTEGQDGRADYYFVLKDLIDYYNTQLKVEKLYQNPLKWAEMALQTIAGMGPFSSDNSINNYAKLIWDLPRVKVNSEILDKVKADYMEHDQCRILYN